MAANRFVSAAKDGDVGPVESYLDNEDNDPNVKDGSWGWTALQVASQNNKAEVVGVLLGCDRTDINATDSDNDTALHYAAARDSVECARQLLEGKADVSIKSKTRGETALEKAKRRKSKGVAALIEQHLAAASGGGQKVCLRACVSVCVGGGKGTLRGALSA
eukprot:COSAG02_NODE_6582_length_3478_cov_13.617342_2_plen_162_part_00